MTKIFISHRDIDTEFSMKLAQALRVTGIEIWIDKANIRLGKNWSDEVQEGLDTCEAMIVVVTPESMASKHVQAEWQYYLDEPKPLFLVIWRPMKLTFELGRIQYIDFHNQVFETKFDDLCEQLQKQGFVGSNNEGEIHELRSDEATPPPTPPRLQGGEKSGLCVEDILPPPFEWCEIPAGKVTLEAGGYLKEATTFDVPAFKIAKYPITNAQYGEFDKAPDGLIKREWWKFSREAYASRFPGVPDYTFFNSDAPRTKVTWYDSIAFCRWLSAKTGIQITLPTEKQWQCAAIGDSDDFYPWGNEGLLFPLPDNQPIVGVRASVTEFSHLENFYGLEYMGLELWEWCLNEWESNKEDLESRGSRAVRGGMELGELFGDRSLFGKLATERDWKLPHIREVLGGFRIVVPVT